MWVGSEQKKAFVEKFFAGKDVKVKLFSTHKECKDSFGSESAKSKPYVSPKKRS